MTDDDNFDDAQAEAARAQAEARRKRILEKANKRLGVVSGEEVQDEGEKKMSSSNAARIRAARQRRYKQKAPPTPSTENVATSDPPADAEVIETSTQVKEEETKPDPAVLASTTNEPEAISDSAAAAAAAATTEGGKKKYVGVAKMRRKMIAKKNKEEEEASKTAVETTAEKAEAARIAAAKKVAVFPILMHILIAVLLFLAGVDVGMQQFHDDVVVHPKTTLQEYGLPFVARNPFVPVDRNADEDVTSNLLKRDLLSSSDDRAKGVPKGVDHEDEFAEIRSDDESENVPNIDPLFRVDLDEMTKGPGFLKQMARGAVSIHRMILYIIYYTPINLINTAMSIPVGLMKMPPALFLIALSLRQVLGKMILGAFIPEARPDDNGEKNNIEVLSMAKNFVKNFFATNFPTLVWAYDVFCHLRSDMYIVLCGVFLGMAYSHYVTSDVAETGLPYDAAPAGDLGDEL
jgi:hypothetical protein